MVYMCVDESGSYNTTVERYYIISAIIVKDLEGLQNAHKKIEQIVRKSKKSKRELKASSIKDHQKAMFINEINNSKYNIVSLAIDKETLHKKHDFIMSEFLIYNYALKELIRAAIQYDFLSKNDRLVCFVDNRTMNPKVYYDLESYLNLEYFNYFKMVKIMYKDSATTREIQMADYISNTVYGYLNKSNKGYTFLDNPKQIKLKIIPRESGETND